MHPKSGHWDSVEQLISACPFFPPYILKFLVCQQQIFHAIIASSTVSHHSFYQLQLHRTTNSRLRIPTQTLTASLSKPVRTIPIHGCQSSQIISITEHLRFILAPRLVSVAIGSIVKGGDIQLLVRGTTEVLNYAATQILFNIFTLLQLEVITIFQLWTIFCFLLPTNYSGETFESHGGKC